MKEPSIEEKSHRYDEVIERANSLLNSSQLGNAWIYKLLPELKESEDEKIIQFLIHEVKETSDKIMSYRGMNKEAVLAWLEKQCKKTEPIEGFDTEFERQISHIIASTINKEYEYTEDSVKRVSNALLNYAKHEFEKQGEQNYKIIKGKNYFCVKTHNYAGVEWIKGTKYYASDNYTLVNQGCECYCPEYSKEEHNNLFEEVKYNGCVEKQNEQKPADKIEPKFHEGDWIIFNGLTLYIKEVVKGYYRTISKDSITNSYDWNIDNVARLWTIQDAKDGDVLVRDIYPSGPSIYIFKEFIRQTFTMKVHCSINNKGQFLHNHDVYYYSYDATLHPATKEQKDLLFQKMKEAGYMWDADEKELYLNWRPSEKQLNTLEKWLSDTRYDGDSRYVWPIFDSLYKDLKKLAK